MTATATAATLFEPADRVAFAKSFPLQPLAIRHRLADNPLFTLPKIIDLVRELPADSIEYNSGKAAIGQDPGATQLIDLDPAEVVRRIETCGAWMVLKRVEAHPAYRAVIEDVLLSVARENGHASLEDAGFEDLRGFLFVSSPESTTPFHVDPEDNIFVHIHGDKFFTVCDNRDGSVVPDDVIEQALTKHRNVGYSDAFEKKSTCYSLKPGDGLFVPYLWPHWVRTGSQFSISMAVTWKTKAVMRKNDVFVVNSLLRRAGLPQRAPGRNPALDAVKLVLFRSVKAVVNPLRKSLAMRALIRKLVLGKDANYYMKTKTAA
ncbi:MAG: cupin-like domain-containing protein [Xanthobacteraceae bacterium]|uniref:cupin-like domain-containing protein n=1 Tax=Pseudolabrys sp. TaxID=1960880 RepID=UPI003D0A3038